ncbi:helix-turn-helix domain-containing protein [Senegalia massiliensis]|uniref:XRE family transcriptional regulator n=1 Tax=Senegalia massiliensis TaxID=1720316 RepID=A0A845QXS9_9CLOT|nr:helix-turn-helix transcriptional regulator [Senegalia massiliensis]NBI07777.1 XRE family transcriptional regulator [Senegalia massiliensis]
MENNTPIDNKSIGLRIRNEREKFKLSREELAELINLSDYYIGQLERGERQMSLTTMVNISKHLHISLDYLIFGDKINESAVILENNGFYLKENLEINELLSLLNKCSDKELELFQKLLTTVLPYIT